MVANLSSHRRGWDERWEEFSDWAEKGKSCHEELLARVDADTDAFNQIMAAFGLPQKTEEEQAERAANRAVDLGPWVADLGHAVEESDYLDTLATVRYRQGDFDSAVELAWDAWELREDPYMAGFHLSQAARFELARSRASGATAG